MTARTTNEFLSHLRSLNVQLTADGDRLRFNAPAGAVTPALRDELAARKSEILRFLKEAKAATAAQPPPIARIARDGELPLSFAQQRLWLLNQLEPGGITYSIPALFRFKGSVNLEAFEWSFTEIVRRHEVLRARFLNEHGRPVQKIAPPEPFKIAIQDLQSLPASERQKEADRLAYVDATTPFDLTQAPQMRVTLIRLAADEQVLLLNMYHIASDGWSFGVLVRELTALYNARLKSQPSPLAELPIQYVDFAVWQRQWLQGEVLQGQLDYWKERLSGSIPALQLPTDRPRPAVQTFNGGNFPLLIPTTLYDAVKALSQREDVTPFMTVLAAFKILLHRYSNQEDILIGTPIANRNRAEIEGLIGFFVNMLVMRTDLSGNPTFRELARRVRDTAFGAYQHQDLPFEKLVEELHPERDVSRTPFFQVMFVLLNTPMQPLELPGLAPSHLEFHNGAAKFDLSVYFEETPQGLSGWFSYNSDLFDEATMSRMAAQLNTLLTGIVANPEQRIADLPLLPEAERKLVLDEFNATRAEFPQGQCLHQLFEEQVERTPDATALVFDTERLTYRELNRRANQLAHHLRELGVGPETFVGVCMKRSTPMIVALLGILKAGGAYVALDPEYPRERLAFMRQDSNMLALLTQQSLVNELSLAKGSGKIICLDTDWDAISRESDLNPPGAGSANNLAYVIYTSGSTGRPKGVAIEHHSPVVLMHWARGVYSDEELSGVLAATSICFDLSVFEIFVPLSWGGKVILAENALALPNLPARQEVRLVNTVPSAITELLRVRGVASSVQTVNLAGEPLTARLTQQIYALPHIRKVYDLYGPSEDTTYSTFTLRRPDGPATIGRPLANTQVYLVDRHLRPTPLGVPGELCISGEKLARGYLNQPELTAQKFIPNPFSSQPGERLYRTGDLARYLPDGNIEFLGRMDHQVKIRGFRIELGEIESVLSKHPAVRETVVLAREDAPGEKRIVAYVVGHPGQTVTVSELRTHLKEKLPEYMVPSAFVQLPALPLTPNGKLDRKALPVPDGARPELGAAYTAPKGEVESTLVEIWQKLLRVDRVGVNDNFFDLGGHSLLVVQAHSKLCEAIHREVPIIEMFKRPTISLLAEYLSQAQPAAASFQKVQDRAQRQKEALTRQRQQAQKR